MLPHENMLCCYVEKYMGPLRVKAKCFRGFLDHVPQDVSYISRTWPWDMHPAPVAPSDECLPDSISEDAEDESVVLEPSGSRELWTDIELSWGRLLLGESFAGSTLLGSACGRSRQQGSEGSCLQTGLGVAGRVWWVQNLLRKATEEKAKVNKGHALKFTEASWQSEINLKAKFFIVGLYSVFDVHNIHYELVIWNLKSHGWFCFLCMNLLSNPDGNEINQNIGHQVAVSLPDMPVHSWWYGRGQGQVGGSLSWGY